MPYIGHTPTVERGTECGPPTQAIIGGLVKAPTVLSSKDSCTNLHHRCEANAGCTGSLRPGRLRRLRLQGQGQHQHGKYRAEGAAQSVHESLAFSYGRWRGAMCRCKGCIGFTSVRPWASVDFVHDGVQQMRYMDPSVDASAKENLPIPTAAVADGNCQPVAPRGVAVRAHQHCA